MSDSLSTIIYCVTTHFHFYCCYIFFSFDHEELYLSKEQCYLFVMYRVSRNPLRAVNCIPWAVKICLLLSDLYHRCLCQTYVHACLGCVFIYWQCINHFMYSVTGLFTTNNNWPKGFCQMLWQKTETVIKLKREKEPFCYSFLFFSLALYAFPPTLLPTSITVSQYIRAQLKSWMILDYVGNNVPLISVSCLFANVLCVDLAEQKFTYCSTLYNQTLSLFPFFSNFPSELISNIIKEKTSVLNI